MLLEGRLAASEKQLDTLLQELMEVRQSPFVHFRVTRFRALAHLRISSGKLCAIQVVELTAL